MQFIQHQSGKEQDRKEKPCNTLFHSNHDNYIYSKQSLEMICDESKSKMKVNQLHRVMTLNGRRNSCSDNTQGQKPNIFDIIRRRPSANAEETSYSLNRLSPESKIITAVNSQCTDEDIIEEQQGTYYHPNAIDQQEKNYFCCQECRDGYVDIFSNDANFIVCDDGWIEFASDEEESNIKRALKKMLKGRYLR